MQSFIVNEPSKFGEARLNMVRNQVMPNGVSDDSVLCALSDVPKHLFVNEKLQNVAYSESNLEVIEGRELLEPLVFAKMLQAAAIKKSDMILDVGCGFGYSSVVLSMMCKHVVGIEDSSSMNVRSEHLLKLLRIENCVMHSGEVALGYPSGALYDVIFVNGSVNKEIDVLLEQLNEGGRLLMIEQLSGSLSQAVLYLKSNGGLVRSEICYAKNTCL